MMFSGVGRAARTGSLLALFMAGLALGIEVDAHLQPVCVSTSLWSEVKSACSRRSCDGDAVSAFLASRRSCADPEVGVALPAISAIATSLLAANVQGRSDAAWASARESCKLAGGFDCSRPRLERMTEGYVQK
jgi:hypothetical protein